MIPESIRNGFKEACDIPKERLQTPGRNPGWGSRRSGPAPTRTRRSQAQRPGRRSARAALAALRTRRGGTRGRKGRSGVWQRRGGDGRRPTRAADPLQPRPACTAAARAGSGSVCVGFPPGGLLVGLPKLVHSTLIHGIKPATRPCGRQAGWRARANTRVLGA